MRVALIDDSPISRELFTRIATALDHDVLPIDVAYPTDLAGLVDGVAPDLVVLDARFGDPLGTAGNHAATLVAIIAALRERLPRIPIAIVAALGEPELVRRAAAAGAKFVIPRPHVRASVEATLAAVANGRTRAAR